MEHNIAEFDVNNFYYLSRSCLVKDERNLDKFDRVFGTVFKGLEPPEEGATAEIHHNEILGSVTPGICDHYSPELLVHE